MGRKDASQHFTPVDQYRKQIGKQDWKKSRKEIKAMKCRADETIPLTAKNIALMIGVSIVVLSFLYVGFFWYMGLASLEEPSEPTPF